MMTSRKMVLAAGLLVAAACAARAQYTAVVNPASVLVANFQGWGTSLAWWSNVVGGYSNRNDYCDLAFENGLGLNIIRYNIGGGENPALTNTITNYRAIMQGFEPANGVWNWNADQNQRWILTNAIAQGADIVDAFANSPPWWMTVSGSVTGNTNSNASLNDNLQTAYEIPFAVYLATVVSNLNVLDGVTFNYCTPMNEPVGTDWKYANGKQEGCNIDPGQQGRLVNDLRAQLIAQAPSVGIDAGEDFSEQNTFNDLDSYTNGALPNVSLFTTHTYSANDASALHIAAVSSGKPIWVAEYGDGDATGLTMAQRIHDDITEMRVQGWVYWQFVDNAGGWGCLYNPLVAATNASFTTDYSYNEKYFTMAQFSDLVVQGCDIISVNDNYTLAAYYPALQDLVLVMVNTNTASTSVTYNLDAFTSLPSQVTVYQTDANLDEYTASLPSLSVSGGKFTSSIPGQSVTSFVLAGVTLAPVLVNQPSYAFTNPLTLYSGANPTLSVSAVGGAPLGYQWFSNGVALAGVTTAAYTPPTAAQGTNIYDCVVANAAGSITSQVWSVSVVSPPTAPFPQSVLALSPVGYWRLDEPPINGSGNQGVVCHDYWGGNNGVYSNADLGQTGYNPTTDPTETATLFGSYLSTNSDAGQIANVDFSAPPGGNAEFSVVAWVMAGAQTSDAGIVAKGYGGGGEQFVLDTGSDSVATHGFRFFVRDAFGNAYGAGATITPDGNWHYLVGVCDEANGQVHLYVDGVDAADASMRPGMALLETSGGSAPGDPLMAIGSRSGSQASASLNNQFDGTIDDVAVVPSALTAAQIVTLYSAALAVNTTPTNILISISNNLMTLSWPANHIGWQLQTTTNIVSTNWVDVAGSDATNIVIVSATNPAAFYRLAYP